MTSLAKMRSRPGVAKSVLRWTRGKIRDFGGKRGPLARALPVADRMALGVVDSVFTYWPLSGAETGRRLIVGERAGGDWAYLPDGSRLS